MVHHIFLRDDFGYFRLAVNSASDCQFGRLIIPILDFRIRDARTPPLTRRTAPTGARMTIEPVSSQFEPVWGRPLPEIPEIGNWRSETGATNRPLRPLILVSASLRATDPRANTLELRAFLP